MTPQVPRADVVDEGVVVGARPDRGRADAPLHLGAGARLRSGTVLYAASLVGERFETGHHVVVREECWVGADVSIWSGTTIDYGCHIGDRVKIHCNCYVAQYTRIDDDAFLAPGVTIANDLYPGVDGSRELMSGPWIGRGAAIGVNATILPFVRIGAGAIIGAGAVVTRDIPAGSVAYGNPAVVANEVDDLRPLRERLVSVDANAVRYQLREPTAGESGSGR